MQLFYAPDINGIQYTLSEEESKHCVRVLRKSVGDAITLVDGRGGLYKCELIDDAPKKCVVSICEKIEQFEKRSYVLHMAVAPTKNIDRFEWFLEKATEIGVDIITPVECFHSERRIIKCDRSEKVITSAVKQSVKAYHPVFEPMTPFKEFVSRDFMGAECYIAHCEEVGEKHIINDIASVNGSYVVLVGPEGDFSIEEINFAISRGFKSISLGKSRLRTETAGVMVAAYLAILNQ